MSSFIETVFHFCFPVNYHVLALHVCEFQHTELSIQICLAFVNKCLRLTFQLTYFAWMMSKLDSHVPLDLLQLQKF